MTVTQIIVIENNKQGFLLFMERNQRFPLFHCRNFINQLPNGFPVKDSVIHALGCGLGFRKLHKVTCLRLVIFYTFPNSRHIHAKPIGLPLTICQISPFVQSLDTDVWDLHISQF
jgi:hypothetical protein